MIAQVPWLKAASPGGTVSGSAPPTPDPAMPPCPRCCNNQAVREIDDDRFRCDRCRTEFDADRTGGDGFGDEKPPPACPTCRSFDVRPSLDGFHCRRCRTDFARTGATAARSAGLFAAKAAVAGAMGGARMKADSLDSLGELFDDELDDVRRLAGSIVRKGLDAPVSDFNRLDGLLKRAAGRRSACGDLAVTEEI